MKKNIIFTSLTLILLILFIVLINSNNKTSIEVGEYLNLEISYEEIIVTDEEVEKRMKEELTTKLDYTTVTKRSVQTKDLVNIDFEGKLNGEPFDGGTSEGYDLEIGSGAFIPGFEDQIIGMKTKDVKDIFVTFPEDYHSEDLAGKDVVFTITLNSIKVKEKLPKLTDKVIKDLTEGEFTTIKSLKKDLKKFMEEEAEILNKNNMSKALWDQIVENSKIGKLPNKNIKYYEQTFNEYYVNYAANFGIDLDQFIKDYLNSNRDEYNSEKTNYAKDHVTRYELAKIIATIEDIKYTKKEYDEYVERNNYDMTELAASKSYIEDELLFEIVTDFIKDNTIFINKETV